MNVVLILTVNKVFHMSRLLQSCCLLLLMFFGHAMALGNIPSSASGLENILLHTDRDVYVAGEDVYFRIFQTNDDNRDGLSARIAYLLLQTPEGKMVDGYLIPLDEKGGYGSIYLPDTLSSGFYALRAYTRNMLARGPEHMAQKLLFVSNRFDDQLDVLMELEERPSETGLVPYVDGLLPALGNKTTPGVEVSIQMNNSMYGRRERADFQVELAVPDHQVADVSVAVVPALSLWPFLNPHEQPGTAAGISTNKLNALRVAEETIDPLLTGRVTDKQGHAPVEGVRVLLNTLDSLTTLTYTSSCADGYFSFAIDPFLQDKTIYLTWEHPDDDKSLDLRITDLFEATRPFEAYRGGIHASLPPYVRESQDVLKVQKAYGSVYKQTEAQDTVRGINPHLLYSQPVRVIDPARFVPLDNFQEIAREIIPWLRIRRQRGEWTMQMHHERTAYTFFSTPPAVFINGLPVGNKDTLMGFTSEMIQHIELLNIPWRYGDMAFTGVMSIFTRHNLDPALFLPQPYIMVEPIQLHPSSRHLAPEVGRAEGQARIPDFRQLLFWEPAVRMHGGQQAGFSFHTGDLGGTYVVVVKGMLKTGEMFYQSKVFDVVL